MVCAASLGLICPIRRALVINYDHRDLRCRIVPTGWPEQDAARRSERARCRADVFATPLLTATTHIVALLKGEPHTRSAEAISKFRPAHGRIESAAISGVFGRGLCAAVDIQTRAQMGSSSKLHIHPERGFF